MKVSVQKQFPGYCGEPTALPVNTFGWNYLKYSQFKLFKKTLPTSTHNIKASLAAMWSSATLIPDRFNIIRFVLTFINGLTCYHMIAKA